MMIRRRGGDMFGLKIAKRSQRAGQAMKSAERLDRSMSLLDAHIRADVGDMGRPNEIVPLSESLRWRMVEESRFVRSLNAFE
jgi:ribosomal protein S17